MKQALLKFPDLGSMTEFILRNRLYAVESNSKELTVGGMFTDKHLTIAEGLFNARVVYTA